MFNDCKQPATVVSVVQQRSRWSKGLHLARWLIHTPWPILALDMLRANLVGALFTFAFLRFGMPIQDSISLDEITALNQVIFAAYLLIAMVIGGFASIQLSLPVLIWHRRRTRLDNEAARSRALALPMLLTAVNAALWVVGGTLFTLVNLTVSSKNAFIVAIASTIGAMVTCALSYMQAEKVMRPITVAAMANNPDNAIAPSVTTRITAFWVISVVAPMLVIIGMIVLHRLGIIEADSTGLERPILWMAISALAFSVIAIVRVVAAINDPIKQLRRAQSKVSEGDLNVAVKIYDGSDLGLLQAGFNDMVADLRERQQLRNLFGRYVGEDVARRAIETGTELGGEERYVGVLFVDIVGSTRLAVNRPPREIVELLNEFFRVVVGVVGRHGGFVNKFQGDAALAVFRAGDFKGSQTGFANFIKRYPRSNLAPSALFWLGNAQYATRDYKEAITNFRSLLTASPNHQRAPEAMLSIANCQIELKDTRAARATLESLVKTYPQSEAAQAGRERLSRLK